MNISTKNICITAMGIALFVVFTLCLQVPVFENYYVCLGYIVMMVYCYHFGMFSGMTVGCFGVVLYCVLTSGLRGMPGWALGNLFIGFAVGLACKLTQKIKNQWIRYSIIIVTIVLSTGVGMLIIKSLVEVCLYAQPMLFRMIKNIYAFVSDTVVLIVGLPVCISLERVIIDNE